LKGTPLGLLIIWVTNGYGLIWLLMDWAPNRLHYGV